MVLAIAIPLGVLSNELNDETIEIIEGFSKMVGAVAVLQLSLKIPVWIGLYEKLPITMWCNGSMGKKKSGKDVGVTLKEIRFNVAWNIWREVAECGVFLIPFFLGSNGQAIPLSALAGIVIALVLGMLIYIASYKMNNKFYLSFFMGGLMLMLSVGLFVGGCHEFEEVWGMTPNVWKITNPNLSHKKLPMAILKPFGYSSSRSVLQICCFWLWLSLGLVLHYFKWSNTKKARADPEFAKGEVVEVVADDEKDIEAAKEDTSSEEEAAVAVEIPQNVDLNEVEVHA